VPCRTFASSCNSALFLYKFLPFIHRRNRRIILVAKHPPKTAPGNNRETPIRVRRGVIISALCPAADLQSMPGLAE
jgi:hypothetical protein